MPFLSVNGINLYYERRGAKTGAITGSGTGSGEEDSHPPLLFISGTGGDLRVKPNVMDGPLASQFDLIAFDQRGLGQSEKPTGPYTMADYADDAAGLLDGLGLNSANVIGVSFGGMVAQHLVLRHPHKVKRLVLACTSSGGAGGASFPFHDIQDLEAEAYYRKLLPLSDTRLSLEWQRNNDSKFQQAIEKSIAARAHLPVDEDSQRGARLQLEARQFHDTWSRLGEIKCPVYLCGGKYDGICPPSNLQALHQAIPHSTLDFFEGGHLFMMQDKKAAASMADFLRG
ncbi:MAG: alpha/beta hydrolase [Gammaproteobacteria bacterium]|nr:alpha/beta hydrolase [Gammaproteobacteria bacterium]